MELITSKANPKIKQIRALRQHKARQAAGLLVVEGIRPVGEAIAAHAQIESLVYAPDLLTSDYAQRLITEETARGVPAYPTTPDVFSSIAEKDNPQGLLAVVVQPHTHLASLNPNNFSWGVAAISPQDPGNTGAILRTIDAAGASGLILIDNSVDPFHPTAVRASMGALFWLPVAQTSFSEFSAWASTHAYQLYGTSAHASQDYREIPHYEHPCILLLGSEREGLSLEQLNICQHRVRLPMAGRTTSLNLAVAAGILLYDMLEKQASQNLQNFTNH
ncbi:MAG TPA: RNA methyltransferase [Anaerolineales bacterium]|nr:RNA methyltransferase [Anaerolineales bacterium]